MKSTLITSAALVALFTGRVVGFALVKKSNAVFQPTSVARISNTQLHFFGRKNDRGDEDPPEKDNIDFFSFLRRKKEAKSDITADDPATATPVARLEASPSTVVETPAPDTSVPIVEHPAPEPSVPMDPISSAAALRAQAVRIRLEAEKMDAQLTLDKIARLERELAKAQSKGENTDSLVRDMENLQRKIRGEPPIAVVLSPQKPAPTAKSSSVSSVSSEASAPTTFAPKYSPPEEPIAPFSQAEFDRTLQEFDRFPSYLKVLLARSVGMQPMSVRDINATEYAIRSEKQQRLDFSFLKDIPPPSFTSEEIEEFKKSFSLVDWRGKFPPGLEMKDLSDDDFIKKAMEEEYYFKMATRNYGVSKGMAEGFLAGNVADAEKFAAALEEELGRSQPYQTMQGLFPKCVEKEGQIPTQVQVKMLMTDVLPQAGFNSNSQPIEVFGGYLIRGSTTKGNGDELIDSIDAIVAKNPMLQGKFTISFIKDLTGVMGVSDEDFEEAMMTNLPRALYVMGPNVTRERNRLLATLTSGLGIATSWYFSIYPFLLNPAVMKRAEEQLALADASMTYEMGWLTDLATPMFATFLGLQIMHEIGHRVVAGVYGMDITLPTFVPSIASGITSSITNLKNPPKNRTQLFDFAIAGPLVGILASLAALYTGLELTVASDTSAIAMFPALPIDILRQSSLGGGLIEYVLGNGVLGIPGGAQGSQAVASINIPLHPVAIAGYVSLIVNALSLLPIGTTDGGRISQAVFNRAGKQIVGQIFLLTLFAVGLFGNDLFLFYGFFCAFFQQGSEIPQRNEVDDVSFARVLFATAAGVVALLSIIPMQ